MRRVLPLLAALLVAAGVAAPTPAHGAARWVPAPMSRYQLDLPGTPTAAQLRARYDEIELDAVGTPASTVAAVHALGRHAVCYVDVGTWERWRPDAARFPRSVLGRADQGWPGERWLDIRRQRVLLPIMAARLERCVRKGFDAVDPDNVDGVENPTGFPLTARAQLSYDRAIAAMAHADGLTVALKSDAGEAAALEPSFDFVVEEQCAQYAECARLAPFVSAHKAVFDVEYTTSLGFCGSLPSGVAGLAKHLSLDWWVRWCAATGG